MKSIRCASWICVGVGLHKSLQEAFQRKISKFRNDCEILQKSIILFPFLHIYLWNYQWMMIHRIERKVVDSIKTILRHHFRNKLNSYSRTTNQNILMHRKTTAKIGTSGNSAISRSGSYEKSSTSASSWRHFPLTKLHQTFLEHHFDKYLSGERSQKSPSFRRYENEDRENL